MGPSFRLLGFKVAPLRLRLAIEKIMPKSSSVINSKAATPDWVSRRCLARARLASCLKTVLFADRKFGILLTSVSLVLSPPMTVGLQLALLLTN